MQWAIERYRYTPLFAAKSVDDFWYYHLRFLLLYPTLWTLVGLLAIAAVICNARLGWLAITVFGVSFLLASFAGQKEMRYFCFAQPFIAMLWGLGLAQLAPAFPDGCVRPAMQLSVAAQVRAAVTAIVSCVLALVSW